MEGNLDRFIEDSVKTNPLPLLALCEHEYVIDRVNFYLPYSTGFEIECNFSDNYNVENFKRIPNIIDVNNGPSEQRYRIPHGILGLICLYNICEELKYNSTLNEDSGIHYHVDMTDCFSSINHEFINKNKNRILKQLDKWEYTGTYNERTVSHDGLDGNYSTWLKFNSQYKTAEFRIGEMSFDYSVLFDRISNCNSIIRGLKIQLLGYDYIYDLELTNNRKTKVDAESILEYVKDQQDRLMVRDVKLIQYESKFKDEKENKDDPNKIINSRVIDRRKR